MYSIEIQSEIDDISLQKIFPQQFETISHSYDYIFSNIIIRNLQSKYGIEDVPFYIKDIICLTPLEVYENTGKRKFKLIIEGFDSNPEIQLISTIKELVLL